MANELPRNLEEWRDPEDFAVLFRLLGVKLQEMWSDDRGSGDLIDAIYAVAEDVVGSPGPEAMALGDSICNSDDFRDKMLLDVDQGAPIAAHWTEGRLGATVSLSVLDFGTGARFLAWPPNADQGRWMYEISDLVDPADPSAVFEMVYEFITQCWFPDAISYSDPVTRDVLHSTYKKAFDEARPAPWSELADWMGSHTRQSEWPVDTEPHRERILNSYLDYLFSG